MNGRNGKSWLPMLVVVASLSPCVALAQTERVAVAAGEGKLGAARLVEVKAKVEAIDLATRKVTLRHEDGELETLVVSEEAKNLAQVKVGDMVTMQAYQSLTVALNKVEGAKPELSEKTSEQRAELGQLPGGLKTHEVAVVAKVTAIDPKESVVTLTGPRGNSVELEVAPEVLAKVKVGDHVNAVYTEAVAVSVSRVSQ
jgi:Cu/Ag efflux protein CusF